MATVARCPGCRRRFPWDPTLGYPTRCPLKGCDYTCDAPDETVIAMPFLRSARMKATDDVYRQTEKASENRAHMAAEMAGVPGSEMSGLKVTNMRDNARAGENSVSRVVNSVTQQMDMIKARGGQAGFGVAQAKEFASQAQAQAPRAGVNAADAI